MQITKETEWILTGKLFGKPKRDAPGDFHGAKDISGISSLRPVKSRRRPQIPQPADSERPHLRLRVNATRSPGGSKASEKFKPPSGTAHEEHSLSR